MIDSLSILIPCHNCDCTDLVKTLHHQCEHIDRLVYEIVIVDDGSDCQVIIDANRKLEYLTFVTYKMCVKSKNRSAMRNRLATFAKYDWQLQINGNVQVSSPTFLQNFLDSATGVKIVSGNTTAVLDKSNLRSKYEYSFNKRNDIIKSNNHPYSYFRNTCCLYHRSVFSVASYDENITGYGFEDVLFGQKLRMLAIPIRYIDNPVVYNANTSNSGYVQNTEESLHTLHCLHDSLLSTSPILKVTDKLQHYNLLWLVKMFHKYFGRLEKANLCGSHPSVLIFSLYKLGYYISIR